MLFRPIISSKVLLFVLSLLTFSLAFSSCGQQSSVGNPIQTEDNPAGQLASIPTTVLSIVGGDVFLMRPGSNQWVKAEEGISLDVDYKLKTEINGEATISFFDGSSIELKGETQVTLRDLGFDETSSKVNIRLRQELGQTISRVKKLADPESRYEIETPAAVAAGRGTTMFVQVAQDGTTFVGNIEGLVSVVAQGIEVKVTQGSHVVVMPGHTAGPVEPGTTPSPVVTSTYSLPTQNPTPSSGSGLTSVPPSQTAKIAIEKNADRQTAYPGDTIVYSYRVTNSGSLPLSDILVTDVNVQELIYNSGDINSNGYLDVGETWLFSSSYLVKAGESGLVINTATVSGTGPNSEIATASADASVSVIEIIVKFTSLQEGSIVTRTISIAGTVNDPSITQATITVNGQSSGMDVIDGNFNTSVELADGSNTITVTVTKAGGVVVSSSVMLEPQ